MLYAARTNKLNYFCENPHITYSQIKEYFNILQIIFGGQGENRQSQSVKIEINILQIKQFH